MFDEWNCANCGNTDGDTLWDEGDTIYCSNCYHRTRKEDGEDDLVECPVCHHMKDRKAYYCMWCNNSGDSGEYDPEADAEADSFLENIDSSNLKYGKFKK